jgi:uncharacterized protein YjbI with pentapeptide repeats
MAAPQPRLEPSLPAHARSPRASGSFIKHSLSHAVLIEADLTGADLTGADLTRADLTRAAFTRADLTDVRLIRADFTRAAIYNADFTGADLTGAVVTDAKWSADRADRQAPEGWELDAGSGRLRRAGIGSEPAEAS